VGTVPIEKLSKAIVEQQALDVDGVSGATITADAVRAAVADALKKAGIDPKALGYVPVVKKPVDRVRFNPAAMPEKAPKTDSVTITDAKGRKVTIDLPVSSYAISTMDVIDYIIPLLGKDAFNKLVASGESGSRSIGKYDRVYTPVVGKYLEHFGQISEHNAPFDLEMILARDPDVFIVNSAMGAHHHVGAIMAQLEEVGIPIVMIDVPGKSVRTSAQKTLEILGKIFQQEGRAAEVVAFLDNQYDLIASKISKITEKPEVYYEFRGYSEVFGLTQTSKRKGWGDLIAVAGGDNIADTLLVSTSKGKGGRGTLDPEIILQVDPDFIILSACGAGWMDNFPHDPAKAPSFDIVNRTGWRDFKAVRNQNVYELAHAMNRSIYGFYACLKMATIFHPDEFKEVDPEAVLAEFFDRFMMVNSSITHWVYRYEGPEGN
jgi:iron complex transport system substrate-binding protein